VGVAHRLDASASVAVLTAHRTNKNSSVDVVTGRKVRVRFWIVELLLDLTFRRLVRHDRCPLLSHRNYQVKVKVKVTLRLTASQSVCLGVGHPFGAHDQILLFLSFVGKLLFSSPWAPSLTRGRVCNLQCNLSVVRVKLFTMIYTLLDTMTHCHCWLL
jgi:hypothetical protein